MTETVGPEANGSAAEPVVGAKSRRTERQALRRQVLVGGATTAGVLLALANRPALAGNSQASCSTAASLSPSHQLTQACGQPANCWQNSPGWDAWAPGAKCNNQPVSCTHNTTVCSVIPQLSSSPFNCSTSSQCGDFCKGNLTIQVKCGRNWITLWSNEQQGNVCAAILNDCFYGDFYSTTPIINTISSCLSTVVSCASSGDQNGIQSACTALDNVLAGKNCQGGTNCSI